jgi:hypothetical protein
MSEGYHPGIDNSSLCIKDDSAKYRSIIGCCIWIINLDKFEISYATFSMSRFNMIPREGHLKGVKRILSYLMTFPKGRVIIETSYPDHTVYSVDNHSNQEEFYQDYGEEIPKYLSLKIEPRVSMTVYVYADHAHDLVN